MRHTVQVLVTMPARKINMTTKAQLIERVAVSASITKKQAAAAVDAVATQIVEDLAQTGLAILHGVGNFKVTARAEKPGRNPRTGEKIMIPAGKRIGFSAAMAVKQAI